MTIPDRLADAIQHDLPLTPRPFNTIGEQLGTDEQTVIEGIRELTDRGALREISAILDGTKLGFHSSLVALRVGEQDIDRVAVTVNAHPGVSHNYLREHEYTMWFTLAVPREKALESAVHGLVGNIVSPDDILLLPAVRRYKLRVRLPADGFRRGKLPSPRPPIGRGAGETKTDSPGDCFALPVAERKLLAVLEQPLPVVPELWTEVARRSGIGEHSVIESIGRFKEERIIRRISGVLRHGKIGYGSSGMASYAVPLDRADEAGATASRYDYVSHCYFRDSDGRWPYPLFVMIHARSREECRERARVIAREIDCPEYRLLFSTRELKKERVRYFETSE